MAQPGRTSASVDTLSEDAIAPALGRGAKRWIVAVVLALVVLGVLASWTHHSVQRSLRELHGATLASVLDEVAGTLELESDPRRKAELVSAVRIGRTGEAYAFDARGDILPAGLVKSALPVRAQGERRGVVLEPYINHRGARVIGAWRWLPEHELGVAAELDAAEAYAPLGYVEVAFGVVAAALGFAVAALLAGAIWRRRQRVDARQLGAYVIERRIGEGGMANVYLAHHALLKRPTALKILKSQRVSEQFVERFEREVKIAGQLAHPNVVEIYDYGRTPEGQLYYAMEYLDGLELHEVVKRSGALPSARAIHLLRQTCAGLAEAHARGLVHRDIKPENIMVCVRRGEHDVAKILDFGLVKNVADPHTHDLTRSLRILGTPLYMAPERFRNPGDVDARTDIYSLGAVAFYLLTGRELFEAADDLELASRVLNDEAPRPSSRAPQPVPLELDLLVTSCLEKRREDRPQRVTDLIEAFDALAAVHCWTQREAAEWWAKFRPQTAPVPASAGAGR